MATSALGKFIGTSIANTMKNALSSTKKNTSSSSSGSSSSRPSSSAASNTASSTATSTPDWLKQAQANSQAWHTADAATKKTLQEKNNALYSSHGYTYDGKTGTWSAPKTTGAASAAKLVGNVASTAAGAMNTLKDRYSNTDYSRVLGDQMANGASWQDVQQSINDRKAKIALSGGNLDKYSNDQTMINAQSYVNSMKQIEDQYQAELDRQDEIKQQQQAYYDAMADQINQQYSAMLPSLNQSYDDAARQAYINYRTSQRDLPEQLAAAGISGQGASESSLVAQNNAYNSAYNQNELARANAIQSVENNRASALAGNSTQAAQSMAELANSLYQQRQSILAQQEQARQNVIGNLLNYGNTVGMIGTNQTLDGQQTLANIAYNKRQLDLQQQSQDMSQKQYEQSAQADAQNAARDYYLKLWKGMGIRGATAQIAAVLGIPAGSVYDAGTYNANYY